jgi:hypothetical protein
MAELPRTSFNFADEEAWPSAGSLSAHIKTQMAVLKEVEIPRQATELDRRIGHAVFELFHRRQEEMALLPVLETS